MRKVFLILIILFFYFFLYYRYGLIRDKIRFSKIEAIVVLTGEKGRIPEAIKIFNKNRNIYLIISGANPNFSKEFIKKKIGLEGAKNLIIENRSKNTIENALEVKKILKRLNIRNIVLVTSCFHIPRAYLIFKIILPKNVTICRWGVRKKFSLKEILEENVKIVYFLILLLFKKF